MIDNAIFEGELFDRLEEISRGGTVRFARIPRDHSLILGAIDEIASKSPHWWMSIKTYEDWERVFLIDGERRRPAWVRR